MNSIVRSRAKKSPGFSRFEGNEGVFRNLVVSVLLPPQPPANVLRSESSEKFSELWKVLQLSRVQIAALVKTLALVASTSPMKSALSGEGKLC